MGGICGVNFGHIWVFLVFLCFCVLGRRLSCVFCVCVFLDLLVSNLPRSWTKAYVRDQSSYYCLCPIPWYKRPPLAKVFKYT